MSLLIREMNVDEPFGRMYHYWILDHLCVNQGTANTARSIANDVFKGDGGELGNKRLANQVLSDLLNDLYVQKEVFDGRNKKYRLPRWKITECGIEYIEELSKTYGDRRAEEDQQHTIAIIDMDTQSHRKIHSLESKYRESGAEVLAFCTCMYDKKIPLSWTLTRAPFPRIISSVFMVIRVTQLIVSESHRMPRNCRVEIHSPSPVMKTLCEYLRSIGFKANIRTGDQ